MIKSKILSGCRFYLEHISVIEKNITTDGIPNSHPSLHSLFVTSSLIFIPINCGNASFVAAFSWYAIYIGFSWGIGPSCGQWQQMKQELSTKNTRNLSFLYRITLFLLMSRLFLVNLDIWELQCAVQIGVHCHRIQIPRLLDIHPSKKECSR